MLYDCIVIGGGIAGLQAAIQLGRYQHDILVMDSNGGRSDRCLRYRNLLGYPSGVSGPHLLNVGRLQAKNVGVQFVREYATKLVKSPQGFRVISHHPNTVYEGKKILIATGVMDRIPDIPGIDPCLGESIYVCPDCDGYETRNRRTVVMGSGDVGANMALTLTYWTTHLVYINHDASPIQKDLQSKLQQQQIDVICKEIQSIDAQAAQFERAILMDGTSVEGDCGFVAFGGNRVNSQIAEGIGVEISRNGHIPVDQRTKQTNVPGIWAAGDVVAHSEQVSIAMGDGSQAAIWIHKHLIGV